MKKIITKSSEETIALGRRIIECMPVDVNVILLEGELSSGKTTLTKGIGEALGIKQIINSPTFTILKIYQGNRNLYHMDLYRMNELGEDFDLEEYIDDAEAVTVIEWPGQVAELIPNEYIKLNLKFINENEREIIISSHNVDDSWEKRL